MPASMKSVQSVVFWGTPEGRKGKFSTMRMAHISALSAVSTVSTVSMFVLLPAIGPVKAQRAADTKKSEAAAGSHSATLAAPISYHEDVEPILKASCGSCHSSDKHNGGFIVETPDALFRGGLHTGAKVVVPRKATQSGIVAYLKGSLQPRMPLNQQSLPEQQIALIAKWIDQGAKVDTERLGWPYAPPSPRKIPQVKQTAWSKNPIDQFILARLEAAGLRPSPRAGKVTLLRRVYADLIGIPPSPESVTAFLNDTAPNAYEKVVDRLLADPRYGERWARHWLDLVRYAETHGFENDGARPRAWRYRDYVIRAFNDDKPYDRFLKEQIAGDEMYPDSADAIVATGFARLGSWDELSTEPAQRWQDYLNDVTDTTGSVALGLTVACARCHNHKYDKVTQADYYRLQAFYTNTQWVDARLPGNNAEQMKQERARLVELKTQQESLKAKQRQSAAQAKKPGDKSEVTDEDIDRILTQADRDANDRIEGEIRDLEARIAPYEPSAEAIHDQGRSAKPAHILLRGSLASPGREVQPGFVASLCGGKEQPAEIVPPVGMESTGRRTALANWIASSANPLTARVMVNRIWQHHFGRGIVGTPSDFGKNGDRPSHPELLDWLALRFMADGWSIKKMHRLMVLSETYKMSSQINPQSAKIDPENRLLWHMNRLRMEGEVLRDSILAVSGRLNPQMGGPSVYPKVSDEVLSTGSTHKWGSSPEDQGRRRTIYVFQRRSLLLPIVETFDGADMTNTCPRRASTTIAPQALALFNGEFARTEAQYIAERVSKSAGESREAQIDRAYRLVLCRPATPRQMTTAMAFLKKQTAIQLRKQQAGSGDMAEVKRAEKVALTELCHVLINTNEFIYLD